MIPRQSLVALAAVVLAAAPAARADETSCVTNHCLIRALFDVAETACKNSVGCVTPFFESCEDCCDMPVLGQIPCLAPMFKIGGGVVDKSAACKCCKCCAASKKGECCCTKKPKTAAVSVEAGCVTGMPRAKLNVFRTAVCPPEPYVAPPTMIYRAAPPPTWSGSVVYPQPIPMAVPPPPQPPLTVERTMYVAPKPMHICVARSEPASEVRKVEWRTESDFLGTAGHLEIHNGNTTVCCEKMMLKVAGCGSIKVSCDGTQVSLDGPCIKGKADHVTTDHQGALVLKGNVQVSCDKDGQSVKVQGSQCTVHVANGKVEVHLK